MGLWGRYDPSSAEGAEAYARDVPRADALPVLIEVDADGHRSGAAPGDTASPVAIGRCPVTGGAAPCGVLLYAGDGDALADPGRATPLAEHSLGTFVPLIKLRRNAVKEPIKPGSGASKTQEGGALGNIDEETGHPGKGTGGATVKPEQGGDRTAGREKQGSKPRR